MFVENFFVLFFLVRTSVHIKLPSDVGVGKKYIRMRIVHMYIKVCLGR